MIHFVSSLAKLRKYILQGLYFDFTGLHKKGMIIRMMDYRKRIKEVREDRDFTQAQIGKLLNKSQQGYNHIEAGRAELKIEDLIRLCKYYHLSADYLIGLTDVPKSLET